MGWVYTYYVSAVNDTGRSVFLRVQCSHRLVDSIEEVTEQQMNEEIAENKAAEGL